MSDALFVTLILYFAISIVVMISAIGKPRVPLAASTAAVATLIDLFIIGAIIIWGH